MSVSLYAVKPRFQHLLSPLAEWLALRRVNPDVLTLSAVGCGLLGGGALALSPAQPQLLWLVPALAAVRLALNALDGMVATRRGVARAWGKVLNELCDRLADLAFFWPLAMLGHVPATAAIASMLLVSFVGVLGEAAGTGRQYGGVMGKADRMLWLGLACAASAAISSDLPLRLLPIVIVGGSLLTLVQRLERIHAAG